MIRRFALTLALLAGVLAGTPSDARELNRAKLLRGSGLNQPADFAEFAPPEDAAAPTQRFEGRLTLTRKGRNGYRSVLLYPAFVDAQHRDVDLLPEFDFEFIQDGADLIPVRRGAISGKHPAWELILEPGRVWQSAEDDGYSRAALPFTLEERNANCMHNGVLTFLFKSDGKISRAAWQVGAETCLYEKFDAWGWLDAKYRPGKVQTGDAVVAAYRAEVSARMPAKPIAQLAKDYPGAEPQHLGSTQEVAAANMSAYGFVIAGVHYTGGCETRHGTYPFCDVMDLPSYSLAKSIVGAVALMRLELLYPGVSKKLVRDFVPQCATDERWNGVTFENTLDMATGLYASSGNQADEGEAGNERFFFAPDHEHRIEYSCHEHERKSPPGTLWVYHTTDTYVLGTALQRFVKERRGEDADFYRDVLVEGLWKPLKLSPPVAVTRRTYDGTAQPFSGYGLTLHRDDLVKLAKFLLIDGGKIDGQPLLDPALLNAGLQRDPADPGLQAGGVDMRYNHGFWAYNAAHTLGCQGSVWIPFMSGFGGLQVVMLPNDTVYYYVSDGGEFKWASAAAESNRIKRFCNP